MDSVVFGPVYWLRKNVVEPMKGEAYPWYHRRFNRVPGIEDCYTEDVVCRSVLAGLGCSSSICVSGRRQTLSSSETGWGRRGLSTCSGGE